MIFKFYMALVVNLRIPSLLNYILISVFLLTLYIFVSFLAHVPFTKDHVHFYYVHFFFAIISLSLAMIINQIVYQSVYSSSNMFFFATFIYLISYFTYSTVHQHHSVNIIAYEDVNKSTFTLFLKKISLLKNITSSSNQDPVD